MTLIDTVQRSIPTLSRLSHRTPGNRHASVSRNALDTPSVQGPRRPTQAFVSSDDHMPCLPGVQSMMESSYTAEFRCALPLSIPPQHPSPPHLLIAV